MYGRLKYNHNSKYSLFAELYSIREMGEGRVDIVVILSRQNDIEF